MFDFDLDLPVGIRNVPDLEMSRKAKKRARNAARHRRASANLLVDMGGTCQTYPSIAGASGSFSLASGGLVGLSVDMLNSNTYTNILVTGILTNTSGQLRVAVQSADNDVSGQYTDPTSGLPQLPTSFQSGGILIINSGGLLGSTIGGLQTGSTSGVVLSGQAVQSGFSVAAAFQRPANRFARVVVLSGDFYVGPLTVSLIGNLKTTGSGGGFSYSPTSGTVNV